MTIQKVHLICFSPTGTTLTVLRHMAGRLPFPVQEFDVTQPRHGTLPPLKSQDLAIIGIPVYGGRVPKTALERFSSLHGSQTPAILVATYGNRDYDDALLELKTAVEQAGFTAIAAAAVVTEHSIAHRIGAGRPSQEDYAKLDAFIEHVRKKLDTQETPSAITVKGNPSYRAYHTLPLVPHSTAQCVKCGICALHCTTGAILKDAPDQTDKTACIGCMRCIRVCPHHARKLHTDELNAIEQHIKSKCSGDKQSEFFL